MTDPLGLIQSGGGGLVGPVGPGAMPRPGSGAPNFQDVLRTSLDQVNAAQRDANRAMEDLSTGERTDVEGVILATQKADTAFRMLQAVRNKVMEAYEEMKQMRV